MKRLTLLCLLLLSGIAASAKAYRTEEIPNVQLTDRNRYVSNPDGILSAEAVSHIDSVCRALRAEGVAQVAVVAVDEIASDDTFSFAVDLFRQWGVGNARNDNGLGILLVRRMREIRFVTGGGLEGTLPDALCKRIQTAYMLPAFREGDYDRGMTQGVDAAAALLQGGEAVPDNLYADDEPSLGVILTVMLLVWGGLIAILMAAHYRQKRCPRCGKYTLRRQSQQVVELTRSSRTTEYTYICTNCGQTVKRRERRTRDDHMHTGGGTIIGGWGGFGGSGGGSFGGGGFGGGSFGGGGAGSKW